MQTTILIINTRGFTALLFAAGAWNFGSQRVSLVQYSGSSNILAAERAVAEAQARVEQDMARAARIRRSSSLLGSPIERLYNGPQSKEKDFPAPTDVDKATLESPDEMYTKTPRVKRHNRFGPNNRCDGCPCFRHISLRFRVHRPLQAPLPLNAGPISTRIPRKSPPSLRAASPDGEASRARRPAATAPAATATTWTRPASCRTAGQSTSTRASPGSPRTRTPTSAAPATSTSAPASSAGARPAPPPLPGPSRGPAAGVAMLWAGGSGPDHAGGDGAPPSGGGGQDAPGAGRRGTGRSRGARQLP